MLIRGQVITIKIILFSYYFALFINLFICRTINIHVYIYTHAPKDLYYCDAAIVMPRDYFIPGNLVKGKISVFLFHVYITNLQRKKWEVL